MNHAGLRKNSSMIQRCANALQARRILTRWSNSANIFTCMPGAPLLSQLPLMPHFCFPSCAPVLQLFTFPFSCIGCPGLQVDGFSFGRAPAGCQTLCYLILTQLPDSITSVLQIREGSSVRLNTTLSEKRASLQSPSKLAPTLMFHRS